MNKYKMFSCDCPLFVWVCFSTEKSKYNIIQDIVYKWDDFCVVNFRFVREDVASGLILLVVFVRGLIHTQPNSHMLR